MGSSRSGVIFSLERDRGREKIRSERSRDRSRERSEGKMPSPCRPSEKGKMNVLKLLLIAETIEGFQNGPPMALEQVTIWSLATEEPGHFWK